MTEKLLFTGKTHNTSGRDGGARSSDGHLDIKMTQPHPAAENLFGAAMSRDQGINRRQHDNVDPCL